ncbi:MAG: hypothetical protein Q8N57_02415 [bacterium]|nr:hypothetical protein [bacterium]
MKSKLKKIQKQYKHWNLKASNSVVHVSNSDCSDIGTDCHGDGECGGDGE